MARQHGPVYAAGSIAVSAIAPSWRICCRALIERLIADAEAAGFRQMIAVIGDSTNTGSIELHRYAGFHMVGTFDNVGFKFGRWLDSVLMQRPLGAGATTAP